MQVHAKLRNLRRSPKKVRLVADVIRGMDVNQALHQLQFINKGATYELTKLLNSAIANAENNNNLSKDNLFVKEITVDGAGFLKRWMPRAHGRATMIRKRMSHVTIVLDERVPTTQKKATAKKADTTRNKPAAKKAAPKKSEKTAPAKKTATQKTTAKKTTKKSAPKKSTGKSTKK